MALTTSEAKRLDNLEQKVNNLTRLIAGAGSINQLNRLYILAMKEIEKLEEEVVASEAEVTELLELARKVQ